MPRRSKRKTPTDSPGSSLAPKRTEMEADGAQWSSQPEFAALIRSIIREEINDAIGKLQPQLEILHSGLKECRDKLDDVELALSDTQERVNEVEKVCAVLQKENKELREKTERLEMFSRRFNIRVFGLDKDVEKGHPTEFMASFLKEVFKDKSLPCQPEVEIAHRVGPAQSGSRPMIVRMQRHLAKEAILQIAKKERVLNFKGMKVKIFPDLTAEMSKRRAQFKDLRMKLHQAEIKHGLIHPATLVMTFNGETKYFQDHITAETFFNQAIRPTLSVG